MYFSCTLNKLGAHYNGGCSLFVISIVKMEANCYRANGLNPP